MASAKSIKVVYFDITGRAEILRLLLTVAGKQFEDVRLDQEKWKGYKASTPYGQLPLVEIDGKVFAQSLAIAGYLAREFGLHGKTNLDTFKIDEVALLTEDFIQAFAKTFSAPDEAKKAEIQKKLKEEDGPKFLGFYEKILEQSGTGYVVGSSLTLADLIIFDVCTGFLKQFVEGSVSKFPKVKALVDKVGSNDRIKPYVAARK